MGAYLIDHPPVRDQFYRTRNRPLTGCTVLHTAESVMDSVGPDTGAEAVAEFIRTRTTPGSYHDLVDSDSWLRVVPLESGAYHDATGSNNWALSLSFACRTTDWDRMSPEQRRGFLRNGARAFADQQAWRRARGLPLTELRLITKAQSDRGESGFTYHGFRDPGRRSDPGVAPPNDFPFAEFIAECAIALGITQEDTVSMEDVTKSWYEPRFRGDRNFAQVIHNIEDQAAGANTQIAGLTAALASLAQAVASGRDDLTAEELTDAVDEGIRRGGAAVLVAQEAARASAGSPGV